MKPSVVISIKDLLDKQLNILQGNEQAEHVIINSGFEKIEELGGFYLGEFAAIASSSCMGKTKLLVNLALNISLKNPLLFISYQHAENAIAKRFLSSISNDESFTFDTASRFARLKEEEKQHLMELSDSFNNYHLYINANPPLSLDKLKTYCVIEIEKNNIQVIMIDGFQYINTGTCNHTTNTDELEYITQELKDFALDYNICLIVTCPLNRNADKRKGFNNKRPVLSDLKGCGVTEQYTDKIIFIYRPEYYGFDTDENGNSLINIAEIVVAKNRNGFEGRMFCSMAKGLKSFIEIKPKLLSDILFYNDSQNKEKN